MTAGQDEFDRLGLTAAQWRTEFGVPNVAGDTFTGLLTASLGLTVTGAALTLTDQDLVLGTATGSKIGSGATQKLAFYGATPIVQPANTVDYVTMLTNLGLRATGGTASATFPGLVAATLGATITGAALTVTDQNIVLGTATGSQIGSGATQKLAFYGATPIVQPANTVDYVTMLTNLGLRATGGTAGATFPGIVSAVGLVNTLTTNAPAGGSTAAAGSTTTDAGVLPSGTATVYPTTAADGTKGVRVSATDKVTGQTIFIGNGVSNAILKVYAPSGGTINGASADAAFSSVSGKGVIIHCLSGSGNTWLAW